MANELTKIPKFRRCVLQNFPFIEQDFDALTDYQLLCKVVEYLNKVITSQNEVIDVAESLTVAFNQLQSFVEDYFDNLDVQEEINKKLDEMAEDGTLQEIITAYIQANVAWTFNTVDDMKTATNLVNGSYAQTLGFHSLNDGGGALYYNTGTANEMDVIAIDSLYAVLCPINATITIKQFGSLTSEDNTAILQEAINFGIDHKCKLIINSDVNINTLDDELITINGDIEIDGNHQKIYNNVIGDYHSVFMITGKVDIKNLTLVDYKNNAPTAQTGIVDDTDRIDFYLRECTDSNFENITIDNCLGIWQFICVRCENVNIKNNIINYNDAYTVNYDRTSMYLNGANIICENNLLNGVSKARTGIEAHGDNVLVKNNRIIGYRSPIYIVNDESPLYDEIHQVNIIGNYCKTERGLCIWLEGDEDVDTINILDNTIISTGDWYGIHTYDVLGENFTVKNINIKNNVIKHLGTTTKETFRFSPTQVGTNKNVTIKHITITDNDITEGGTGYTFELYDQLDGVSFGSIIVKNNTMTLNSNTLAHYVSTAGRINNVEFVSNIIKNNGTSLMGVSTSTKNGEIQIHDNIIEKTLTSIAGGNVNINTSIKGTFPVDLKTLNVKDFYYVDIKDILGNSCRTSANGNNYILYNSAVLTGTQFKKGDIIYNTNPVIGSPFGWISIGNDNFRIIQNILGGV